MTIIEQIKAEIEKLKAKYRKDMYKSNYEGLASGYKIEAYNELLSFLSTLESEKPMQEGFEEEMDKYVEQNGLVNCSEIVPIARHFAQWGAERFAKIVRGNLSEIGNNAQSQFEQLYFEIIGTKMYGGYND